jgi:hypothetical protein
MQRARPKAWFVAGCLVLLLSPGQSRSQHTDPGQHPVLSGPPREAMPSGPSGVALEFENETILVLRIRMSPREKTPMHDVSARLVVWLTDAHLRDVSPDGRSEEIVRTPGAIDWIPTQQHSGENLSDTPLEFLAIVPKAAASAHPK